MATSAASRPAPSETEPPDTAPSHAAPPIGDAPERTSRRAGYIDWMRGLAVIVMVFAHAVDSWTRLDERKTQAYFWFLVIAGMGAPMFLWLAGLSVPLAAHARLRRGATVADASWRLQVRGWQIFGLAMLFRLQAYVFSPGASLWGIFKVDILNVMGVSLVVTAWLWGRSHSSHVRIVMGALVAVVVVVLSAPLRAWEWPALLPDPLEFYLRPQPNRTTFTLFPWMAFVPAGLMIGEWLAMGGRARARPGAGVTLHAAFAVVGSVFAVAAYSLSFQPTLVPGSQFWTTSPAFFAIRAGALVAVLGLCYFLVRPGGFWDRVTLPRRWSPMEQLGRTSLFVYWIHVELAYGIFSRPLHKQLSFEGALVASTAFMVLLLGASVAKTVWWDKRPVRPPSSPLVPASSR
jgi:uncharacterized membrane protein